MMAKTDAPVHVVFDLDCGHSHLSCTTFAYPTEYCPDCRKLSHIVGVLTVDQTLRRYENKK